MKSITIIQTQHGIRLNIEAYNETPVYEHLFLQIVSLGGKDNKNINWGATISDKDGNYYYTSFFPAGYFLPWVFMKILRLPANEENLYIFNSVLYLLSAIIWALFIYEVYGGKNMSLYCHL